VTTVPENHVAAPPMRRGRASSRPPGAPEDQSRRRPPSRRRPESNSSSPSTRRNSASAPRTRQQLPLPPGVDAVCDGLTVTFDIRYVDGEEGERVAAAQAAAVSALLNWLAHRDAPNTSEQGGTGWAAEEGRAA